MSVRCVFVRRCHLRWYSQASTVTWLELFLNYRKQCTYKIYDPSLIPPSPSITKIPIKADTSVYDQDLMNKQLQILDALVTARKEFI